MAGKQTGDSAAIAKLNTTTAVMQRDIKYLVEGLDEVKATLKNQNNVSQEDFNKLEGRVKALEDYNDDNKIGTVFSNLFASKAFTFVIGLIIAAVLYYVAQTGGK